MAARLSSPPPTVSTPRSPLLSDAATRLRSPSPPPTIAPEKPISNPKVLDPTTIPASVASPAVSAAPSPAPLKPSPSPAPDAPSAPPPDVAKEEKKAEAEEEIDDTDAIDQEVFEQLLELDDDEEETFDFSWGMVTAYFQQAITTFDELDAALEKEDLKTLSSLGHFLKGSSAALGIHKVQATCEKIQHYGKNWDDEAGVTLSDEQALTRIRTLLIDVKKEYKAAEKWLRSWYAEKGVTE
ncbi:hypothetical protein ABKN59_009892 [Abortiporus biennis]